MCYSEIQKKQITSRRLFWTTGVPGAIFRRAGGGNAGDFAVSIRLFHWLSTFTGFVAAAELLGLALFHHAAQAAAGDPILASAVLISRSALIFALGLLC